jgi:hypothetical protein
MKAMLTTVLILFGAAACVFCASSCGPQEVIKLGPRSAAGSQSEGQRKTGASFLPPGKYNPNAEELHYVTTRLNARDAAVEEVCRRYAQSDAAERARMRDALNTEDTYMLDGFAVRSALFALRERRPEWLVAGLTAFAMIDEKHRDWREPYGSGTLCLLRHSATRLGADHVKLFHDAARLAGPKTSDDMIRFLELTQGKTLCSGCGYSEIETEAGLGFMFCESKPYNPTYRLEHIAIDISRLVAARGYRAIKATIGSELPSNRLKGVDDVALERALARVRGGAEVYPFMRLNKDSRPEMTDLFRVSIVELADEESARTLLDLTRREKDPHFVLVGLAEGRLFCLVVANPGDASDEKYVTAEGLPGFLREVAEVLRRHARG